MATMEQEPECSLNYVIGRLDGVGEGSQDVKACLLDLSRRMDQNYDRIEQTNERIDNLLLLGLTGMGVLLVLALISGIFGIAWAILQAG